MLESASSKDQITFEESITNRIKYEESKILFFIKFSKIPVPIIEYESFDYYLNLLDENYNSLNEYKLFEETLEINNIKDKKSFDEYKNNVRRKFDNLIEKFKENGEKYNLILRFKNDDLEKNYPLINNILKTKNPNIRKDIYCDDLVEKKFISIDLKSANFNALKEYDNNIFDKKENWYEFMKSNGFDEFISSSKQYREVFFGQINVCKKALIMYKFLLDKALIILKASYDYKDEDIMSISGDEIVLKYKENQNKIILNEIYPKKYNVEIFTLKKPTEYSYYIKEIFDENKKQKNIIKCVPKKFICQFIKKIKNQKIVDNDLKFIDEKIVAKYEKSIFD